MVAIAHELGNSSYNDQHTDRTPHNSAGSSKHVCAYRAYHLLEYSAYMLLPFSLISPSSVMVAIAHELGNGSYNDQHTAQFSG